MRRVSGDQKHEARKCGNNMKDGERKTYSRLFNDHNNVVVADILRINNILD